MGSAKLNEIVNEIYKFCGWRQIYSIGEAEEIVLSYFATGINIVKLFFFIADDERK